MEEQAGHCNAVKHAGASLGLCAYYWVIDWVRKPKVQTNCGCHQCGPSSSRILLRLPCAPVHNIVNALHVRKNCKKCRKINIQKKQLKSEQASSVTTSNKVTDANAKAKTEARKAVADKSVISTDKHAAIANKHADKYAATADIHVVIADKEAIKKAAHLAAADELTMVKGPNAQAPAHHLPQHHQATDYPSLLQAAITALTHQTVAPV